MLLARVMIVVGVVEAVEVVGVEIEVEVTIRGEEYEITRRKITEALRGKKPRRVVKYSVSIDGKLFPVKQVVAVTLQISPMEFGTTTAYQILRGLGFEITSEED